MRTVRPSVLVLFLASACAPASGTGSAATSPEESGVQVITADDMFARIDFLASDALAGRSTSSPGLEAAAAYLVSEYRQMGLQAAGQDGTFLQRYPFQARRSNLVPSPSSSAMQTSYPPNVVALLPGSDPELRDEYVILSAHFDHVGVGASVNGDSIYNGADDNASGTAALLEVAQAFSSLPEPPRRSVVFLHVSGEEHGLLGSRWFSENPTFPIQRVIANVNVDMISRNSPDSIVVIGKDYSTLGEVVDAVGERNRDLGLVVADDMWPEERFFFRSDHFNFARLEIPALFFFSGVHEDYHRPSDSADRIDPDKAARVAKLIFFTVQEIANGSVLPTWDPAGLEEVRRMTR